MRWRLVVLRKAIFSGEFSSPLLKKHSQAVQELPCAAPHMAAGSLLRWQRQGDSPTVLCCEPSEKAAATAEQVCSHRMAPCEWTLGTPNKSHSSPLSVHVKESGVNTPCHPWAYLLPAQWQCCCGSPYGAHCIILKGVRKATLPSHLPVWSSWSVCWHRGQWETLMTG